MVGPAIIATKAAVVQAAMAIEEPLEAALVVVASVAKLVEVGLPVDGCPNTTPPIPPLI